MKKLVWSALFAVAFFTASLPLLAQDPPAKDAAQEKADKDKTGQQILDEAEELKLKAETIIQQKTVIELLEKAIAKGDLDESNSKFAKQLLVDALYRRAERLVTQGRGIGGIGRGIREEATGHLKRAIEVDPNFVDGFLMLGLLSAQGRRGNNDEALGWINKAITAAEGKEEMKEKLAGALVRRASLRTNEEESLADLDAAVKADENNAEALTQLARYWSTKGDAEKAVGYLQKIVDKNPNNVGAAEMLSNSFLKLNKFDEAKTLATKIVESQPTNFIGYYLRAKAADQHAGSLRNDDQEAQRKELFLAAAADYTEALNRATRPEFADLRIEFQIQRAEANLSADKSSEAMNDIKAVLAVAPGHPQALLVRSFAYARDKKFDLAIEDLKGVVETIDGQTDTTGLQLQLGNYYVADKRPRKAVEIITSLLDEGIESNELKSSALRARADAYLAYGKHVDAIKDYEEAIKIDPADSGLLNNLAWVLATSPEDKIRNGERSIELGLKACELTQYKASHILSTLAAGYAEKGDFENAIKWSSKAVELGGNGENDEQLKQELESYKQKKPWREAQETEEKKGQNKSGDNDL